MNNRKPKISVIMPFRNAEKFLDESIRSILNQTFSDFEFIIINDASTDNSDFIVKKYLADQRILYIKNQERQGTTANLNKGLKMAMASIIARMDGDDIAISTRFEQQFEFLENNPTISIIGTNAITIDENGEVIGTMEFPTASTDLKKTFFFRFPFLHPTIMFRKNDIQSIGNYREEYVVSQDIDLFLRLFLSGLNGANISEHLLLYRKHPNNTDNRFEEKKKLIFKMRKELLKKHNPSQKIFMYLYTYITYFIDSILSYQQKSKLYSFITKGISVKKHFKIDKTAKTTEQH